MLCRSRSARSVWETVEIPQLHLVSSWTRSLTCPLCSTTGAGCRSAENCDGPAVAAHSTRWSMSLLAQFIDKIWTSCDHAATVVQWQCLRFSSSPEVVDSPVVQQRILLDFMQWVSWRR